MRRLLVVGCLVVSASCGEVPPNPSAPSGTSAPVLVVVPTRVTIEASPAQLPPDGGTARITLEAQASGTPASNVVMKLSSTGGELSAAEVTTDGSGHAEFAWTGTATSSVVVRSAGYTGHITVIVESPPVSSPPPILLPTPPAPTPPVPILSLSLTATPTSISTGQAVTLAATPANLPAGDTVTSYGWDFDGDGTVDATTASPTQVTPAFNNAGLFSPRVTMITSQGRTATTSASVTVAVPTLAVQVTAQFTTIDPGVSQTYTATVTGLAPGETVISYDWTFDATTLATTAVDTKDFAYPAFGTKNVRVKVLTSTARTATGGMTVVVPGSSN